MSCPPCREVRCAGRGDKPRVSLLILVNDRACTPTPGPGPGVFVSGLCLSFSSLMLGVVALSFACTSSLVGSMQAWSETVSGLL